MPEFSDVRQQDDAVEHRDAEQRDEADAGRNAKGIPRNIRAAMPPVLARGIFRKHRREAKRFWPRMPRLSLA